MCRWAVALGIVGIMLMSAGGSLGADNPSFGNDLKATIALQGLPCDQVIDTKRGGDSDYTAICKDGHRYHIYVNPQGRVVVEKVSP